MTDEMPDGSGFKNGTNIGHVNEDEDKMTSKQKYIYWVPGNEKPDGVPEGVELWCECEYEWVNRSNNIDPLGCLDTYRLAVTETEYRAHHGMKAWESATGNGCPEGYEVIDFRYPVGNELFLLAGGGGIGNGGTSAVHPILRKIEPEPCEHKNTETTMSIHNCADLRQVCRDCGMFRVSLFGPWEKADG